MRAPPARIRDEETLDEAIRYLSERSNLIVELEQQYGRPPVWLRDPGFASLVYTVLEQQVSLASARAVYERLVLRTKKLTAERFLALAREDLREVGMSRQKIRYCTNIANMLVSGRLDLEAMEDADDEAVREKLLAIEGIGPWTADVYLLHSLGRVDIWPVGDLALRVAIMETLGLDHRPDKTETSEIGEAFRPMRSVAARLFWNSYLVRRGNTGDVS